MDSSWHSDSTLVESTGTNAECCPCRPFARQSPPKTFRSAGTSTEPIGLATGISSMSVAKICAASPQTSRRTDSDSPSSSRSSALPTSISSISRPTEIASACRATDRKVQDVYCGISRVYRRPMTPSMLPAPVAASAESAGLDRSRSLTFNSTFNPCYTSTTPPDNDDQDECDDDDDDDFDIDDLISSTFGKRCGRPAGYEMSQSCLEGRATADSSAAPPSAASAAVASAAGGFRPASWAGPPSSIIAGFTSPPVCLNDHHNECKNGMAELSNATVCTPPHSSRQNAGNSNRSVFDSLQPVAEDVHYYWELESTRNSAGPTLHMHNPSLMLEFNQRPIVPIQMGTQLRMAESYQAGAAVLSQVGSPLLSLPTESSAKSKLLKVPQMGRCAVMKPTGSDCCADATVRSAVLVPVPKCDPSVRKVQRSTATAAAAGEVETISDLQFKDVKQAKPHRCPTPPRILSPAGDGESCEVAIADI